MGGSPGRSYRMPGGDGEGCAEPVSAPPRGESRAGAFRGYAAVRKRGAARPLARPLPPAVATGRGCHELPDRGRAAPLPDSRPPATAGTRGHTRARTAPPPSAPCAGGGRQGRSGAERTAAQVRLSPRSAPRPAAPGQGREGMGRGEGPGRGAAGSGAPASWGATCGAAAFPFLLFSFPFSFQARCPLERPLPGGRALRAAGGAARPRSAEAKRSPAPARQLQPRSHTRAHAWDGWLAKLRNHGLKGESFISALFYFIRALELFSEEVLFQKAKKQR